MSIAFWLIAALMIAGMTGAALLPLLRRRIELRASEADEQYRRQLTEVLSREPGGAERAATRAEVGRRLTEAARRAAVTARPLGDGARTGVAVGLAALLPAAAIALYLAVGNPGLVATPADAADRPHGTADRGPSGGEAVAAAERLAARLAREPNDVDGWVLLAQTYLSLGRAAEAVGAFDRAVALEPADLVLLALRGEARVNAADGVVTPAAREDFLRVGKADPRARFYLAMGQAQDGKPDEAVAALQALLSDSPADAPWRSIVQLRIAEIGGGAPTPATPPAPPPSSPITAAPGPSAADVAAAASLPADDRAAMIRSMVDRLAERLAANPDDHEGWLRLIRSRAVLGERERLVETVRAALAAAGNPGRQAEIRALAREQGAGEIGTTTPTQAPPTQTPPPQTPQVAAGAVDFAALAERALAEPSSEDRLEDYAAAVMGESPRVPAPLIEVVRKILATRPDNQAALWYAGLQAAQSANPVRAVQHWTRLLEQLPPQSPQRRMLQARIDELR